MSVFSNIIMYQNLSLRRISMQDFVENFTKLEVCMLSPDNCGDVDGHQWQMLLHEGEWQAYVSAGGCRNYPDTFHTNPQFRYLKQHLVAIIQSKVDSQSLF